MGCCDADAAAGVAACVLLGVPACVGVGVGETLPVGTTLAVLEGVSDSELVWVGVVVRVRPLVTDCVGEMVAETVRDGLVVAS